MLVVPTGAQVRLAGRAQVPRPVRLAAARPNEMEPGIGMQSSGTYDTKTARPR